MFPWLTHLDQQWFLAINNGLAHPCLDVVFWLASTLGDGIPLALCVGVLLWWYDRPVFRQHYLWLVLAALLGNLLVQGLKYSIDRPRPLSAFAPLLHSGTVSIHLVWWPLRFRSFPSGHTQAAAAICTYLLFLYPRGWYLWSTGALLVGLSRIYVGVHFPADVLGGAVLGSGVTWSIWALRQRVAQARRQEAESRTPHVDKPQQCF